MWLCRHVSTWALSDERNFLLQSNVMLFLDMRIGNAQMVIGTNARLN